MIFKKFRYRPGSVFVREFKIFSFLNSRSRLFSDFFLTVSFTRYQNLKFLISCNDSYKVKNFNKTLINHSRPDFVYQPTLSKNDGQSRVDRIVSTYKTIKRGQSPSFTSLIYIMNQIKRRGPDLIYLHIYI